MSQIYLSYRSDDSTEMSGRIFDWLVSHLGAGAVVKEAASLPYSGDLKTHLRGVISQCQVVLVVIGRQWFYSVDDKGRWRRDDPNDPVRVEIETALGLELPMIPLLLKGATMPPFDRLPRSLQPLCYRKGLPVRSGDAFDSTMNEVLRIASEWLTPTPGQTPAGFAFSALTWCHIPAGQVIIDQVVHKVESFQMCKYAVTSRQFLLFMDYPDGYTNSRWWDFSELARQWHRDHPFGSWDSAGFLQLPLGSSGSPDYRDYVKDRRPREPFACVSWYDVMAFCRWLSYKLGFPVTLPTEAQWRRAAFGDDNRRYPWGDDFDSVKGIRTMSSFFVDYLPPNWDAVAISPYGVYGLVNNVFEWTLETPSHFPHYPAWMNRTPPADPDSYRVACGGYFTEKGVEFEWLTRDTVKVTYGDDFPSFTIGTGCRLVCAD